MSSLSCSHERMIALPKPSIARWIADSAFVRLVALTAVLAAPRAARAQDTLTYARALTTWIALPATPGYEDQATSRIVSATRGFTRDAQGNLVRRLGSGTPRRGVAWGIGEGGEAVGGITHHGYLPVHPAGHR